MKNKSLGFTLVELMISLVLGLIIIAAAVQLLISGQRSLLFQSAVADVRAEARCQAGRRSAPRRLRTRTVFLELRRRAAGVRIGRGRFGL